MLYRKARQRLHPLRRAWRLLTWLRLYQMYARLFPTFTRRVEGVPLRLMCRGGNAVPVFFESRYEPQELAFLLRVLRPGQTFFDIGANIGFFSLVIARKFPDAQVYAFEPCLETFETLLANIHLNGLGNIKPHRVALADHTGEASLQINAPGKDGLNTLGQPAHPASEVVAQETVSVTTLDEFVKMQGLARVDVLKVDVEGADLLVFQGGKRLLGDSDAPVILFERFEQTQVSFGYDPEQTRSLLTELGYQIFTLGGASGDLRPAGDDLALDSNLVTTNLVAAKPKHLAELCRSSDGLPPEN